MIEYKGIVNFKPGLIEKLLKICYRNLIDYFPSEKDRFYCQWENEDNMAFSDQDTIGNSLLFTCLKNNPIGYFSWDYRQYPIGLVGQNCILPDFQGKGYGKKQIEFIVKIFQDRGYKEIKAITGEHKFFIPAQKVYISCGFQEIGLIQGDLFRLIEFKKTI